MPPATASGADASNGSAPRSREHNQGNQDRKYTPEQKQAVLRIRRCQATAFYEILAVEKTCTDAEIKKAYRKQSLLTHPDKNGHEHADEAFKMVARAFSVLGDKEKRDKFDRFGTDPDSRFSAHQENPFAGFARRGPTAGGGMAQGGGGGWEEEINPEELFARFFGGGGFGQGGFGAFDTGPQFAFNFGPGIRVHQFGGARPRARPRAPGANGQQQQEASLASTIVGLLPIILLFVFPLLSSLFSGTSQPAMPHMEFEKPVPPYTLERVIPEANVKYFVNPEEVASFSKHKLHQLDKSAEHTFVTRLQVKCENEYIYRQRLVDDAQGWIFQDPVKMEKAREYVMHSCNRLNKLGYRTHRS